MSILQNQAAIEIVAKAVEQLQAIGIDCLVSPMSLPHGASMVLHLGDSLEAVVAADIAMTRGAELAHARSTSADFASEVADGLAAAAIEKASRGPRAA